jgi:amidase
MDDLCLQPALELARRLRNREISARELLQAHLERVQRLNPQLNAVVVLRPEAALARAQQADEALARGERWGPLHGVPVTVKESFDWAGTPTTWGFEALRGNVAVRNAVAVQRLLDAGAVIFGKTNVPVALADWQSFNPVYGSSNNPWDLQRSPGGSSGGAAAALAAGLSALELGSDIGASIRNPAHYCGVWGHKPTWGVVPLQGHELPGDETVDAVDIAVAGPLARSAHDLSVAMDVLSSPLSAFGTMGRTPAAWRDAGRAATQMRVAVMLDEPRAEVDAAVRQALERLVDFLRRSGLQVDTSVRPVDAQEAWQVYLPLLRGALCGHLGDEDYARAQAQAAALAAAGADPHELPAAHWRGLTLTHRDWLRLDERRHALQRRWAAFFERWDLLVCPIAATTAMRHDPQGMRWERMIPVNGRAQPQTTQLFWAGYPGVAGLPATAVPLELAADGLPVGAQLIGPAFGDPVCLRFARWLETAYHGFVAPALAMR